MDNIVELRNLSNINNKPRSWVITSIATNDPYSMVFLTPLTSSESEIQEKEGLDVFYNTYSAKPMRNTYTKDYHKWSISEAVFAIPNRTECAELDKLLHVANYEVKGYIDNTDLLLIRQSLRDIILLPEIDNNRETLKEDT